MASAEFTDSLNTNEQRGLELIQETGGIHQSEFWKELDVSSRTGSRIITSLIEDGLVEREETVYDGRSTYLVKPAPKSAEELDFSLLMAGESMSPFVNDTELSSSDGKFTSWLMQLAHEHQ